MVHIGLKDDVNIRDFKFNPAELIVWNVKGLLQKVGRVRKVCGERFLFSKSMFKIFK